ncbi:MAG: hypothetical protein F9K29_02550 [Hyphomicrobiaceae bacterium]|nr:MAG: hypothetical protein F9K29_02550 [Hyphomicrobiaceae bacterium]
MSQPYANTISGLLKRRAELMADARELRERMAVVGNDIAALDRMLETLGYQGDLPAAKGVQASTRVVYFHRNELRRFCLDELRKTDGPITTRDLAEKAIRLEGRDPRDRRLRADMVRRIGKGLKLLRSQGAAKSEGSSNTSRQSSRCAQGPCRSSAETTPEEAKAAAAK